MKKKCNRCGEMKLMTKFHKNRRTPDGRKGICAMCISKEYYSISNTGCPNCVFLRECRDNIKLKTFTPYCFVSAKYHELYKAEYQREVTA